jgi:hypothetical protein
MIEPAVKLPFKDLEIILVDCIARSLHETRKLEIKKGCYGQSFSDPEILGEYCNWLRRNFTRHKIMDYFSTITRKKAWHRPGIPRSSFYRYFEITCAEGYNRIAESHMEDICKVAEKKSWEPMENEFNDIKVGMEQLFSDLTQLQVLNKMATCINAETSIVLDNLYKSVEKLEA